MTKLVAYGKSLRNKWKQWTMCGDRSDSQLLSDSEKPFATSYEELRVQIVEDPMITTPSASSSSSMPATIGAVPVPEPPSAGVSDNIVASSVESVDADAVASSAIGVDKMEVSQDSQHPQHIFPIKNGALDFAMQLTNANMEFARLHMDNNLWVDDFSNNNPKSVFNGKKTAFDSAGGLASFELACRDNYVEKMATILSILMAMTRQFDDRNFIEGHQVTVLEIANLFNKALDIACCNGQLQVARTIVNFVRKLCRKFIPVPIRTIPYPLPHHPSMSSCPPMHPSMDGPMHQPMDGPISRSSMHRTKWSQSSYPSMSSESSWHQPSEWSLRSSSSSSSSRPSRPSTPPPLPSIVTPSILSSFRRNPSLSLSRAKAKEKLEQEQREREQKAKEEEKRAQDYNYRVGLDELDDHEWDTSNARRSSRKQARQAKRSDLKKAKSKRWDEADFDEADFFNGNDSTTSSDGDDNCSFAEMNGAVDASDAVDTEAISNADSADHSAWGTSIEGLESIEGFENPGVVGNPGATGSVGTPGAAECIEDIEEIELLNRGTHNLQNPHKLNKDRDAENLMSNLGLEDSKLALLCNEYSFGGNDTGNNNNSNGSNDCESKAERIVSTKNQESKLRTRYEPPSFLQRYEQSEAWKNKFQPLVTTTIEDEKFESVNASAVSPSILISPPAKLVPLLPTAPTGASVPEKKESKDPYAEIEKKILEIDLLSSLPEGCPGNYSKYNAKARGTEIVQFYHTSPALAEPATGTNAGGGWVKLNACPFNLIERIILLTPISTRTDTCATIVLQTKNYQHHVFETANNAKHFIRRITLLLATTDFQ